MDKNKFYKQATSWHSCRETFCDELRKWAYRGGGYNNNINTKRLRIAVLKKHPKQNMSSADYAAARRNNERWMKESIRLVNVLEKHVGWGLTTISKVENKGPGNKRLSDERTTIWLLTGSAKWMRSPQLLSLYMLVLRLGRFYKTTKVYKNFDDLKKLEVALRAIISSIKGQGNSDIAWFIKTFEDWGTVLDNHRKLFFKNSLTDNFKLNEGVNGISELVRGHADVVTRKKWLGIKKAAEQAVAKG